MFMKRDRKGKIHFAEVSKLTICKLSIGQTWTNVWETKRNQKYCIICLALRGVDYKLPRPNTKSVDITKRKLIFI